MHAINIDKNKKSENHVVHDKTKSSNGFILTDNRNKVSQLKTEKSTGSMDNVIQMQGIFTWLLNKNLAALGTILSGVKTGIDGVLVYIDEDTKEGALIVATISQALITITGALTLVKEVKEGNKNWKKVVAALSLAAQGIALVSNGVALYRKSKYEIKDDHVVSLFSLIAASASAASTILSGILACYNERNLQNNNENNTEVNSTTTLMSESDQTNLSDRNSNYLSFDQSSIENGELDSEGERFYSF